MGVGAAIVGSAIIGGGTSILASRSQSKAAAKGAQAQEKSSAENIAFQREMAKQQRSDFAPWRDVGQKSLDKIWSGIQSGDFQPSAFGNKDYSVGNVDVTQDPGYQFRMDQGIQALDRSASSRGRLLSGGQQKAVNRYAQGVASQEYGNAYNRRQTEQNNAYSRDVGAYNRDNNAKMRNYNILSSLNQGGQASAAGQAQTTGQLAQTTGNIISSNGRAQNVAQQNIGAAQAGAYQGAGQSINQAAQNWMLYKALS